MDQTIALFPSLFAAQPGHEINFIKLLEKNVAGFHCDILNESWIKGSYGSTDLLLKIRKATSLPLQLHAMIADPTSLIETARLLEPVQFYFHLEVAFNPHDLVQKLKKSLRFVGIALAPTTPLDALLPFLKFIDGVLVLAVSPGASGQPYISETTEKIAKLLAHIANQNLHCTITVDGGITKIKIDELTSIGCHNFAVGSAIFSEKNPLEAVNHLIQTK